LIDGRKPRPSLTNKNGGYEPAKWIDCPTSHQELGYISLGWFEGFTGSLGLCHIFHEGVLYFFSSRNSVSFPKPIHHLDITVTKKKRVIIG
jgi:hypothetical protein